MTGIYGQVQRHRVFSALTLSVPLSLSVSSEDEGNAAMRIYYPKRVSLQLATIRKSYRTVHSVGTAMEKKSKERNSSSA